LQVWSVKASLTDVAENSNWKSTILFYFLSSVFSSEIPLSFLLNFVHTTVKFGESWDPERSTVEWRTQQGPEAADIFGTQEAHTLTGSTYQLLFWILNHPQPSRSLTTWCVHTCKFCAVIFLYWKGVVV
jgi:hypothetical protein